MLRVRAGVLRRLALASAAWLASCAASGSDVHLAPFYTRLATADGGTLVEVAGGLYRQHRRDEGDFLQWRTLAPLYGITRERDGDYTADHPFLLGRTRHRAGETTSFVVPLYLAWSRDTAAGQRSFFLGLPGILRQETPQATHWGWFPFYGRFEDFLTFDEARFVLWPLYVSNERAGRASKHFLWPLFGWTTGGGEQSFHLFPFYGRATWEGRYERSYWLWPFFHRHRNHLGGGDEAPEDVWMFFPFFGKTERGTYAAWTGLWPFFGYSRDTESGFWALDFPWPLVRLQRGPDETRRTRFWPLYSQLESEGLETTSWLWPLVTKSHETNSTAERDAFTFAPLWQQWDRTDLVTGETSAWRKLWPLFRWEREGDWRSGALLELDPFFRNQLVPRHLTSFFRLYEWEEEPRYRRERAFLGLYRRERGRGEERRSFSGLWARRSYTLDGEPARETSLLFGLLRWRVTPAGGFDMLPPAFPGPGWPRPAEDADLAASRTHF